MDDDAAQGVRRKKDSTLVRAAEAVRDGRASAMISAGNTGATMASALLRMGRIKGVSRPGHRHADPGAGIAPDGPARRRRQRRGAARVAGAVRPDGLGVRPPPLRRRQPTVGLLSIGEEPGKGDTLRKEALRAARRRAGHQLHRQRRGPRHHDRRRRRHRHRRVHRQRRAEDARGWPADDRRALLAAFAVRAAVQAARRRAAAGAAAAVRDARPRHVRRRDPARCRRRVHHHPRLVQRTAMVNAIHVAREMVEAARRRNPHAIAADT